MLKTIKTILIISFLIVPFFAFTQNITSEKLVQSDSDRPSVLPFAPDVVRVRESREVTTLPIESREERLILPDKVIRIAPVEREDLLQQAKEREIEAQERRENLHQQNEIPGVSVDERREVVDIQREKMQEASSTHREDALTVSEKIMLDVFERMETYRVAISEEVRNRIGSLVEERVNSVAKHMNTLNMRLSYSYITLLERIDVLVDNMENRTDKVEKVTEKDLTAVYEKLIEVREDIIMTRDMVLLQKGVIYDISITSLSELGTALREAMNMVREDHNALRNESIRSIHVKISEAQILLKEALSADLND